MNFAQGKYYHIFNRSNNNEFVFKSEENYYYFLHKYEMYIKPSVSTIAYCLMPTHFHFLVKIKCDDNTIIQNGIKIMLSSYTKAINKRFHRHGSLFQPHTKAKEIGDEQYLITLVSYIHQNPLRAKLVQSLEQWLYSSYREAAGFKESSFVDSEFYEHHFTTKQNFRTFSENLITAIRKEYWVS